MEITLQYFDGCPNWEVLDHRLAQVVEGRADVRVAHQRVETAEDAARLGFHGSPTVLVNGVDPFAEEGAPVGLACRVFRTPAGLAGSPTVDQLREAISGPGSDV
ncbi:MULTISPECIES: DsbA family protein [Microbacterium]|jgi:hypothetical protein|uniref:DsbA family protein n=1 Tax=Microbacterium TaxID=33882 RepID=UPI0006FF2EE7|nr:MULTISPECIES: DsbA family protein [unclassified Microbacterium]MBN9199743.1 thioredoxin family protein [Microbacterium ginsengisoli]KQR90967.1 alkylmercury lyase [Microbacterium sp. Leaf347]KQS00035.1 alkylmercury lyase [Microbacterium sp. Leaf351]OJU75265.1 MAG: thioredoxin family protein [Microbacterium sp. 71-23]OSP10431.1 thioredoxin family protein [Microbacterium sp. LEMMJ01]